METKSTYRTRSTSNHQTSDWLAPRVPDDALANEKQRASVRRAGRTSSSLLSPNPSGSSSINVGGGERVLSLLGGAATLAYGLTRPSAFARLTLAAAGGALLFRGASGYCPVSRRLGRNSATQEQQAQSVVIDETVIVSRPRTEVFRFWRQFENLPRFMDHLQDVRQLDAEHSHWVAQIPGNMGTLSWNAVLVDERPDEYLAWQSVTEALVDNAGEVYFRDAEGGKATEVEVRIHYRPPAGAAGLAIGRVLNPVLARMVRADVQRLKQVFRTDEK